MEKVTQSVIRFKTNIKCGGCIAKVTPSLDKAVGVANWQVDTANPDKVLTVRTAVVPAEQIQLVIEQAGFKAHVLH